MLRNEVAGSKASFSLRLISLLSFSLTCYIVLCLKGMPEFVELLLQYEADPLQTDGQSFTPMHLAAKYGHEDVVQVLLNSKVDPNIQTITQKLTPLHVAALHSREEVVEVLLKEGTVAFSLQCFVLFLLCNNSNVEKFRSFSW